MQKKIIIGCLALVMTLSGGFLAMAEDMPGPDSDALWNHIKAAPYTEWSYWPDHKGMLPGRAPHGPQHKVFVNKKGVDSKTPPVQYGTIVVKENYSKAHELKAITVMYKIKGYNPKDGDWFWAKYSPAGKALKAGKPKGCIACHSTRVANDFILVHEFK
jgi:cytochrome P460